MTGEIDTATFERIMESLPVEVSFVDEDDVVRYFNKNGDRIFLWNSTNFRIRN